LNPVVRVSDFFWLTRLTTETTLNRFLSAKTAMNTAHRKPLPGTKLDYFDAREAVDAIQPGAYDTLPYTSRVHAENLVRRCDPGLLTDALKQLIERKRDLDFPVVSGARGVSRHSGPDRTGGPGGSSGCDCSQGRRSRTGQPGSRRRS